MEATSADIFVSWLPLYHDMGLIGAWLGCLYFAAPLYVMSPLSFLMRPESWLWAIHRFRATLSGAPNFAYELCLNKIDDRNLEGLDLSSLRMTVNGAEPVSVPALRRFIERFGHYGFRPGAMAPVYGLAENSVGLAFPPPGRPPVIDRVDRGLLSVRGIAAPALTDDPRALEIASCGAPLPGHEVRIVDELGFELGERHEGRLEFRGPSATSGYFRNETKTRELFHGSWLDSGDRGYMAGGEVYITGRIKDIIIRAGRHIYPQEIEEAIARSPWYSQGMRCGVWRGRSHIGDRARRHFSGDTRERSCGPRSAAGARSTDSYGHRRYAARRSHPRAAADGAEDIERQDTPQPRPKTFMKQGGLGRGSERHGFSCCACRLPAPACNLRGWLASSARPSTQPGGGSSCR